VFLIFIDNNPFNSSSYGLTIGSKYLKLRLLFLLAWITALLPMTVSIKIGNTIVLQYSKLATRIIQGNKYKIWYEFAISGLKLEIYFTLFSQAPVV
jgi:hypothetical protein